MAELPPEVEMAAITALDILASERMSLLVKMSGKAFAAGDMYAQSTLGINIGFDVVQQEAVDYMKEYAKEVKKGYTTIKGEKVYWLKDRTIEERKRILQILEKGIKDGQSIPDISAALQNELDMLKSQATRISRTEVARIQNQGTINRYKKAGVKKVKWLVTEPCDICAEFANNIYDIDDAPELPQHPNCKCAVARAE